MVPTMGEFVAKEADVVFWLQVGYLNARHSEYTDMYPSSSYSREARFSPYPSSTASPVHYHPSTPLVWRDAVTAAWLLPPRATITDCELSAAEALARAILLELFELRKLRGRLGLG